MFSFSEEDVAAGISIASCCSVVQLSELFCRVVISGNVASLGTKKASIGAPEEQEAQSRADIATMSQECLTVTRESNTCHCCLAACHRCLAEDATFQRLSSTRHTCMSSNKLSDLVA